MTDIEDQDLREAGEAIAAVGRSAWQPGCVARAFASPRLDAVHFTMQGWIDLEAVRSPLLVGGALGSIGEIDAAFAAFGLERAVSPPEDAVLIEGAMREAVAEAFALALPMHPPDGVAGGTAKDDGFGSWLPLFAALVTQCGLEPRAALGMRVGCAFSLLAGHRRNQGWEAGGVPYAMRDVEGGTDAISGAGAAARGLTPNAERPTSNAQGFAAEGQGLEKADFAGGSAEGAEPEPAEMGGA